MWSSDVIGTDIDVNQLQISDSHNPSARQSRETNDGSFNAICVSCLTYATSESKLSYLIQYIDHLSALFKVAMRELEGKKKTVS